MRKSLKASTPEIEGLACGAGLLGRSSLPARATVVSDFACWPPPIRLRLVGGPLTTLSELGSDLGTELNHDAVCPASRRPGLHSTPLARAVSPA
jgi:hypothetical protein